MITVLEGDALATLRTLPAESAQVCVTSPPYFGLRDYGHAGQMGLEATPEAYVAAMVAVFAEVRRVLRDDGTLWLNIGDSYANDTKWGGASGGKHVTALHGDTSIGRGKKATGLKAKDLIGIPWLLAFALRADGWYLRSDIIWHKPNPMPESVTDRPTKSHEYLFLFAKSERYYYDHEAIKEPATFLGPNGKQLSPYSQGFGRRTAEEEQERRVAKSGNKERKPASARGVPVDTDGKSSGAVAGSVPWEGETRNKRSVWTVTTIPFKGSHFATFPPALIEPCVLAGSKRGDVVLDPFGGAGTTGLVANRLGRDALLIEINPTYAAMARARIADDCPLFTDVR